MLLFIALDVDHDAAGVHHHQTIAVAQRVAHVVRNHERGELLRGHQAIGEFEHFSGRLGIQGCGVFVKQQQLGTHERGHQKRERLTLAARKKAHVRSHALFQAEVEFLKHLAELFGLLGLGTAFNRGELERYNRLLDRGLKLVFLLAIPAAAGLGFLAEGLAAVLFQGKNFSAVDVSMTAIAIEGYAVGLLGLISIKILAPAFYSRKDIKTPVKGAIASLIVVQCCNFVTVPAFGHAGLALSVGLGSVFNALVLFTLLKKRGWYAPGSGWLVYVLRVLAASVAMTAFLLWVQTGLDWSAMQAQWLYRLVLVAGVILGAAVTYFAVLAVLGWRARELRGAD